MSAAVALATRKRTRCVANERRTRSRSPPSNSPHNPSQQVPESTADRRHAVGAGLSLATTRCSRAHTPTHTVAGTDNTMFRTRHLKSHPIRALAHTGKTTAICGARNASWNVWVCAMSHSHREHQRAKSSNPPILAIPTLGRCEGISVREAAKGGLGHSADSVASIGLLAIHIVKHVVEEGVQAVIA